MLVTHLPLSLFGFFQHTLPGGFRSALFSTPSVSVLSTALFLFFPPGLFLFLRVGFLGNQLEMEGVF